MPSRRSESVELPSVPSLSPDDYRLLVESVVDYAIFMLDAEGRVATWNLGAEKISGYEAAEIIGEHVSKFYLPEDVVEGKPQRDLETAVRLGRVEDESWRVRKDGSRYWANVVTTALRDANGKLRGFGKVNRDFTSRRDAAENERRLLLEHTAREGERQLRDSEARYRALSRRLEIVLEGVADGITVQDRSGRVVFANTAAARICGFESGAELMSTPPAEVVARFEMLDADGAPVAIEDLPGRRALAGEEARSAVLHVRERGTRRDWWVLLRSSPVLDAEGKPELAVNIWHDVSAERRHDLQARYLAEATAALGSSLVYEEMLSTLARVLVPGLADWCSIYLLEGDRLRDVTIAHADPTKLELAKEYRRRHPPDPDYAGGAWKVARTGRSEVFNEITDEMLEKSTRDPAALAMLRSVGMRAVLLVPISIRDRILGVVALVSAETDRRYDANDVALAEELGRRAGVALENAELYRAAQEAAETARQSARIAEGVSRAKDEFLATVSHELRTPLSAILGWSTLLRQRIADPAVAQPIEVIHRNAQRQVRLIDDIMDASRVATGKLRLDVKPTDLVSIAQEAIEVIRPSAIAKQIDIEFDSVTDSCPIVGDPERLQQVIGNLLSNAVKFTDAGDGIRLSVERAGSTFVLSVTDTGRGIDPAFLPLVFQPFKQADASTTRRVGGLGLGLALVRRIVELHGGQVAAHSDGAGKGATFRITLPIRVARTPSPESEPSPPLGAPAVTLNGVRVLVVDDEPDARDLIGSVLTAAGAVVETAQSAAAGFDALGRFRPDILVSDIGMPDEDGFSFMRRIRALSPAEGGAIPSLALTAFARNEDRTKAIAEGYSAYIRKPVDPAALAYAVANLTRVNR